MKKNLFLLLLLASIFVAHAQQTAPLKRFAGEITVVDEDVIKYGDELLLIYKTDKNIKMIFESGLLYPDLFKTKGGTYQKKDALNQVVHNFSVLSSGWINSKSGKTRFVKFVLLQKDSDQPTEYFIEIYNPNGTAKGDFRNFVKNAQLVKFKRGNVVEVMP